MKKGILGRKIGMTQVFAKNGKEKTYEKLAKMFNFKDEN